jgi:Holliday junction resolvasome RuvABC endonuclease subunit
VSTNTIILSLDPSTRECGYAILKVPRRGDIVRIASGTISSASKDLHTRISYISGKIALYVQDSYLDTCHENLVDCIATKNLSQDLGKGFDLLEMGMLPVKD